MRATAACWLALPTVAVLPPQTGVAQDQLAQPGESFETLLRIIRKGGTDGP